MRIKYVMPFFLRFNMIFMVFVNKGFIKDWQSHNSVKIWNLTKLMYLAPANSNDSTAFKISLKFNYDSNLI